MTDVKHTLRGGQPTTQYSVEFMQGMVNRMLTSYHKYGHIGDASRLTDFMKNLKERVELYEKDGNTEWLMDVANYAMMEYMHPSHPEAHFEATGSEASPGRFDKQGRKVHAKHNDDFREA